MNAHQKMLIGQTDSHVVPWRNTGVSVHKEMLPEMERLCAAAAEDGIHLTIASGFRSFERQLNIWNAKATGARPLTDDEGRNLEFASLTSGEIISRILRWSALPGASRHHWGSDIDVYDAAAVPDAYKLLLTAEESRTTFARLHRWLDGNMSRFGFFRPYARDLGGIAPEPWHLSYAPVSKSCFHSYTFNLLETAIREADIALKNQILESLPQLFERYFLRVATS